ncbi:hypothetical protein [Spongiivirga citrea]|uniref:Uncharacterized protein n=1 Tax=Spongiivirga citrea TaxID=1481457 RepID=A0A6M0CLI7_9FLAO|nr:hypothetical protein [Spongiivirga citrea]NER18796.1 hypothetical protein [Spongiivirga citrea]
MAQHRFEDQVKKQLGDREINPSADAWQRLSEQLDGENDKKGIAFWKYAVAACMVGLLGTLLWYQFDQREVELIDQQIVEEEFDIKKDEPIKNVEDQVIIPLEKQSKINIVAVPKKVSEEPAQLAKEEVKNTIEVANQDTETMNYFDTKVAEVVAEVQRLKNEKDSITDAEVEALLASAERDIQLQSIMNQNTKTVDANALLLDVEAELERTFRDRVFEALKNGFNKTRTAVANRNN